MMISEENMKTIVSIGSTFTNKVLSLVKENLRHIKSYLSISPISFLEKTDTYIDNLEATNSEAYRNGGTVLDEIRCYAGESGYGGGNSSGGGGAGKGTNGPTTGSYIYAVKLKAGANGAQRNKAGGNSTVNFTNYTPEAETITYFTGGGGASGGSSGGGGGGGSPLGQGGAGGTKGGGGAGTLGSGGGGGGYKAFTTQSGGSGGPGYINIMY